MDIVGYRRLSRAFFFIGAMIACFGLGLYMMEMVAVGIGLLIAGVVILVICFSLTRFFFLMSAQVHRDKPSNHVAEETASDGADEDL